MYIELVDEEQETEPELNLAEEIKTKKLTTHLILTSMCFKFFLGGGLITARK